MPFQIDQMLVCEIGQVRYPDGTKIETSTPIGRVLVVESFPARLDWRVDLRFTVDSNTTAACDVFVVDPRGQRYPPGHLKFAAEPGDEREDIPIPVFTAAVKGTYAVHLYVNGAEMPAVSREIVIDVAASLA
jgi:hypothetical protein